MTDQQDLTPPAGKLLGSPWVKVGLYAAGLALLAGALYMVLRDRDSIQRALAHARTAPTWKFAFLLFAPLINWWLSSAMFTVLTRRYGDIRFGEMLGLIGASWLLNYLPMRPGLIARVAYLKTVRGISIRDSAKVGLQAAACTFASAGVLAELALIERSLGDRAGLFINVTLASVGCITGLAFLLAPRGGLTDHRWAVYGAALGLRITDTLVQALRIRIAFEIIGSPISTADALFLAGPAQIVSLLPIQLGTVEWTVGLLSAQTRDGVTAALLNRAADMVVAVPVGLCALLWLWHRRRGPQETAREVGGGGGVGPERASGK